MTSDLAEADLAPPRHAVATPAAAARAGRLPAHLPARLLRFGASGQRLAIDIQHVREIRRYEPPVRVPGAGPAWLGIVDLRGTVVPVVDLRAGLGQACQEPPGVTIVVDLAGELAGVAVDDVDDVLEASPTQWRAVPSLRAATSAHVVALLADHAGLVQLLDLAGLLTGSARPQGPQC
jgi:purine-binding chemotaxis protein CheW